MTTAGRIAAMLLRRGRQMTMKRRVGTTSAFTEVNLFGVSRKYLPEELVGGLQQGDREIIICDAGALGDPQKGDVIDGSTVQAVDEKYSGPLVVAYVLTVRG
jgi:hypothetical protein